MIYLIMEIEGGESGWPVAYRVSQSIANDYCDLLKRQNPDNFYVVLPVSEDA